MLVGNASPRCDGRIIRPRNAWQSWNCAPLAAGLWRKRRGHSYSDSQGCRRVGRTYLAYKEEPISVGIRDVILPGDTPSQ
jgi:hypothetical protein